MTADNGIIVSGVVLTAAPVEAVPRPLTAIALVSWLRTAWLGSSSVAPTPVSWAVIGVVDAGAVLTTPAVAWAPLIAPPEVLT